MTRSTLLFSVALLGLGCGDKDDDGGASDGSSDGTSTDGTDGTDGTDSDSSIEANND